MVPTNWHALDEKNIYREIMKKPGLYVGAARLDYVVHFANGFNFARRQNDTDWQTWHADHELQYWLLMQQSVAIRRHASINGWTLFMGNYGGGKTALQQFAAFLHAAGKDLLPHNANTETVSEAIYNLYCQKREQTEKDESAKAQCKADIIATIGDIILSSGEKADCVRVFLYREELYSQVRFIIHTENGWVDGMALIKPEHYQKLLSLHANQECLNNQELYRLVNITECAGAPVYTNVYIHEKKQISFFETEEKRKTLYEMYQAWHLDRTSSY